MIVLDVLFVTVGLHKGASINDLQGKLDPREDVLPFPPLLFVCIEKNREGIGKYLIGAGADVNVKWLVSRYST